MLKEVKIDTLHLVGTLSDQEMEEVMNCINFNQWKGNRFFMHALKSKDPFFKIYIKPRYGTWLYTNEPYNVLIHMQADAVKQKPAVICQLLELGVWKVRRVDIAYDWLMPNTMTYLYRNGNAKVVTFSDNNNYYMYGRRNESRAVVYDKKLQLRTKKNVEIEEEALTRLEIRVRPKLNSQSSIDELSWLKKHIDKFVFVSDTSKLSRLLSTEDSKAFRKVRRRVSKDWSGISERRQRRIKKTIKENSVDLYELFEEYGCHYDIDWNHE